MKAVIHRVAGNVELDLAEVDVDSDDMLRQRYGDEVPVLLVDGRKAAKFRISEKALQRRLRAKTLGVLIGHLLKKR